MDGILIVDKPSGLTSHDVVLKVRKKIRQQKVGHTGTLDPVATGVLVIVIGRATKYVRYLTNQDKLYRVRLRLGLRTDTGDIEGQIIEEKPAGKIPQSLIEEVFLKFKGEVLQVPPMVSAKKYRGKPLYKYARKGVVVPRSPKKVFIQDINVEKVNLPEIDFTVHCSKGTYIRTLCEDIGNALGTGGCAVEIRRLRSGPFGIEQAIKLDRFLSMERQEIEKILLPSEVWI